MGYDESTAIQLSYALTSGYWKVASRCFFNKLECLLFSTKIKDYKVTYHFFDEIYTNIDWKKDPVQSLPSMYADRARKIREKYDYVAIMFSGGADSTNVLKSFIDNNIPIDEIITFGAIKVADKILHEFNKSDKAPKNLMFEYYEAALPMFNYLKQYHPSIKLTVIDYTTEVLSLIDNSNLHKLFLSGCNINVNLTGHYLTYKTVSKHDNSCVVLGIDKPRILYDKKDGIFKSYFYDFNTIHGHYPKDTFGDDIARTEYFYYDPEMPYIPVKQCRQLLEHLLPIVDPSHPLHSTVMTDLGHSYNVDVHSDYVKKLLYPTWNTSIFQVGKHSSQFYGAGTEWLTSTNLTSNKVKDYYEKQVKELVVAGVNPGFIVFDENKKPQKFIEMYTKRIPIQ